MTREEKIEIMFESILTEIEKLRAVQKNGKDPRNIKNDITAEIGNLKESILKVKIPDYRAAINSLTEKVDQMLIQLHPVKMQEKQNSNKIRMTIAFVTSLLINIYLIWKLLF